MEGHCIWREGQRVFHVSRHAIRVRICRPSRRYGQNGVLQPYDLPVNRGVALRIARDAEAGVDVADVGAFVAQVS